MNSRIYWAARAQRAAANAYATQEQKTAAYLKAYRNTYDDLVKETAVLYAKYAKDGKLSLTELYRYERYSRYIGQVKEILMDLGEKEEKFAQNLFSTLYQSAHARITKEFGLEFSEVPRKTMIKVLEFPWSGANYSDRIWVNKEKLLNTLDQTVVRGVVKGNSIKSMTKELRSKVESGAYEARRMIRTESMHFINQGQIDGYKKAGISEVEILVAHDERTCPVCVANEGGPYKIEEAELLLPAHPNCRCTFVPIVNQ